MRQKYKQRAKTIPWWRKIFPFLRDSKSSQDSENDDYQKHFTDDLVSRIRPVDYEMLYENLGYRFQNNIFLRHALTHRSFRNESGNPAIEDNERLEFLGDSVLGLVISDFLYQTFPKFQEGDLSRIKSHVVSEPFLADLAREVDLGSYLLLGKGEAASGGHEKNSLLSDCFEAIIASVYLDGGMEVAREFLLRCFQGKIETLVNNQHILDHKSLFQEHAQERFDCIPRYKLHQIIGPNHDKTFEVELFINKEVFSVGSGKSKKEAEQDAAKAALTKMDISTGRYDGKEEES